MKEEHKDETSLLHISLRYESNATSGLLAVHKQPSIVLVIHVQNLALLDGQFSRVCGVIIVESLDNGCMLVLPGGKISDEERNATEDRFRTCSTYAAGTRPTGASSSCFGLTFHQLRRATESQMESTGKRQRAGAQLVVHALDEEQNLVLFESEFVLRVRLGLVVVDGFEDGEVSFWIVGHVEGRFQVEVTGVI